MAKRKKKPRPRLRMGDWVKVVKVPKEFSRHLGKKGKVSARTRYRKMWEVDLKGGSSQFFRHELKKQD